MSTRPPAAARRARPRAENPLLEPWDGPYGGVPPFDRVRVEHFRPALEAAMERTLSELRAVVACGEPPDFANTLEPLERSGRTLNRVLAVYGVWSGNLATPAFQEVQREMAPRLAAFADRVHQDEALFRRIRAVYESREAAGLSTEQRRLAWHHHVSFVRAGARLDAAAKGRMSEINQRLAALTTAFNQNVLADEADRALVLEAEAELAGLPPELREAAAAAAAARGLPGRWAIENTRSAMDPFLTCSTRRDLRERGWRLFTGRGASGGPHDNRPIVSEILALRLERARLLGYRTHAHWRLEIAMARTPERALELMETVWGPAVARVRAEVADMQAVADAEGAGFRLEPWDYRHYAEKVRRARFDLDAGEVKPFLQLERLRDALFWVAGELFGFEFQRVTDVPRYHADVAAWRVSDRSSGREVGLWYLDPFARPGKRSGAWMSAYRNQESFDGEVTTLVSNNANFVPAAPGEPVLISWDDARTLFHEFGHALHGLASRVAYPSLSGTEVARDYVEFPSQLLEHWLSTPEVLRRFAVHASTGEPIPPELVERIERAATFNQGFATTEYLASALVDMKLHLDEDGATADPDAFERSTLASLGMPGEVAMRHRIPHFQHVFGSDGYSAAYYSYLWADVLTADGFGAFTEGDGPYDRAVAERLYRHVFSAGNTVDPAGGFRAFRGRDPEVRALMEKRGFPAPPPSSPTGGGTNVAR